MDYRVVWKPSPGLTTLSKPGDAGMKHLSLVQPSPQGVEVYARLFPLYRRIHDDLASTYAELSRLLSKPA